MGSINQLEKLYQLLAMFQKTSESLERVVACERINSVIKKTEELLDQRSFVREERRQVRVQAEEVDHKKRILFQMKQNNWLTAESSPLGSKRDNNTIIRRIKFNIGGLLFECPDYTLKKDPTSLLAELCQPEPPVTPSPQGYFTFDRDWWLFRHILNFLRDGALPEDRKLLSQIYKEASFWQLRQLQRAIEEQKLHLSYLQSNIASAGVNASVDRTSGNSIIDKDPQSSQQHQQVREWWRNQPSWWHEREKQQLLLAERTKSNQDAVAAANGTTATGLGKQEKDWWTGTSYKGRTFLPLPPSLVSGNTAPFGNSAAVNDYSRGDTTARRPVTSTTANITATATPAIASAPPILFSSTFGIPATTTTKGSGGNNYNNNSNNDYSIKGNNNNYDNNIKEYETFLNNNHSHQLSQSPHQHQQQLPQMIPAPFPASHYLDPQQQYESPVQSLREYMRTHGLSKNRETNNNDNNSYTNNDENAKASASNIRYQSQLDKNEYNKSSNATTTSGYDHVDDKMNPSSSFGINKSSYKTDNNISSSLLSPSPPSYSPDHRKQSQEEDHYNTSSSSLQTLEREVEQAARDSRAKISAAAAAVASLDKEMEDLLQSYIKVTATNDTSQQHVVYNNDKISSGGVGSGDSNIKQRITSS